MSDFRLDDITDDIHSRFPAADDRPLIGITGNYADSAATLSEGYYKQVAAAGGVPVIIPPLSDPSVIINTLESIDGLILSGGGDFNPLWCGEQPSPHLHSINPERDLPELLITRLAYDRNIPMLGICRGIQTLAMALGGRVSQDIYEANRPIDNIPPTLKHMQDAPRTEATHEVTLDTSSTLYSIYSCAGYSRAGDHGGRPYSDSEPTAEASLRVGTYPCDHPHTQGLYVNSFHHQAVADGGERLRAVAWSTDGIIEAVESSCHKPVIGVQWHPEWLATDLPLFRWLTTEATLLRKARRLHHRMLTIDSHCDTPMFFPQGVCFDRRDPRILVDMHKMTEGQLDAVTMVAYLPQPKAGQSFKEVAPIAVETPKDYADLIFDRIESIIAANSGHLAIARTADDLRENKRLGRKSIMLGIENGIALNHDIANIAYFRRRGIKYITLCHNGDNDICDSARGNATHGGVSEFGAEVIKEMNRQNVLVDLSHASEKSFYDAISLSTRPVVCSHSNCRFLCDVPRNITDDQMRALALGGGVMQITLYAGFLRKDSAQASVIDVIKHLEHAIHIMGIDHVGIGTDFDGDGGVPGFASASDVIAFTTQLLRRRYSNEDIARIWGGNWIKMLES